MMRQFLTAVLLMMAPVAAFATETPAAASPLNVTSTVVKSGYFLAEDCKPTADPKVYNECVCFANIKKPVVAGLAAPIVSAINTELSILPQKLAEESCEGKATAAPKDGLKVNEANADYEVAYQTPTTLTVLTKYSTYGAGADHPLEGTEGFTFDLASGKLVDPLQYLEAPQLKKADSFIKSELVKKYPAALFDEAKTRKEPYLTENGCDTCTLFYGKDGWMVRFQLEAIAPYMTGEPEVALPADIIPAPEALVKLPMKGPLL